MHQIENSKPFHKQYWIETCVKLNLLQAWQVSEHNYVNKANQATEQPCMDIGWGGGL